MPSSRGQPGHRRRLHPPSPTGCTSNGRSGPWKRGRHVILEKPSWLQRPRGRDTLPPLPPTERTRRPGADGGLPQPLHPGLETLYEGSRPARLGARAGEGLFSRRSCWAITISASGTTWRAALPLISGRIIPSRRRGVSLARSWRFVWRWTCRGCRRRERVVMGRRGRPTRSRRWAPTFRARSTEGRRIDIFWNSSSTGFGGVRARACLFPTRIVSRRWER